MDNTESSSEEQAVTGSPVPDAKALLAEGMILGGRYAVGTPMPHVGPGLRFRGQDTEKGARVCIALLGPDVVASTDRGTLQMALTDARQVVHKNIARLLHVGEHGDALYAVTEYPEGSTLAALMAKRAKSERRFSLKGAYKLIGHVCNALEFIGEKTPHGTLCPSNVLISRSGRVKVAGLGLGGQRGQISGEADANMPWDAPCFSVPQADDPHGLDIGALGVILYQLLSGQAAPHAPDAFAAAVQSTLPGELADVVLECVDRRGENALESIDAIKIALLQAVEVVKAKKEAGVVDGVIHRKPSSSMPPPPPPVEPEPAAPPVKKAPAFVLPELGGARGMDDDGTVARWLYEKGGVDYGPFNRKELLDKLFDEELTPETVVYDIETDRRRPLSEFAAFDEYLVKWVHEKADREVRRREMKALRAKKRKRQLAIGIAVSIFVGGGAIAGGYSYYLSTLPTPVNAQLAQLVTPLRGVLPTMELPDELPETFAEVKERRKKENRAKSAARDRLERAEIRREERLAASTTLNMGSKGGGKFDKNQVLRAVSTRNSALAGCIQEEVRRDPSLKSVSVKVTIIPDGRLINVKLKGGTSRGRSCVRRALKNLRVAPFSGTNRTITLPFMVQ